LTVPGKSPKSVGNGRLWLVPRRRPSSRNGDGGSGAAAPPDLDTVADELYAVPPEEFVAARDEHVAAAKATGDRQLANAVGALRRPTQAGWLANLLVRERPGELDALLALGAQLREAQAALRGPELRSLLEQRRAVVGELVRAARRLAAEAGRPVAEAAGWDLEATLESALADEEVAAAVRSGRLLSAVAPGERAQVAGSGGSTGSAQPRGTASGASARGGRAVAPSGGQRASARPARQVGSRDELAERRLGREREARKREQRRLRDGAQRRLDGAVRALAERQEALAAAEAEEEQAQESLREAQQAVGDAERALAQARLAVAAGEEGVRAADRVRREAAEAVGTAEDAVQEAQEALDALDGDGD
jgi:hypothetical protein